MFYMQAAPDTRHLGGEGIGDAGVPNLDHRKAVFKIHILHRGRVILAAELAAPPFLEISACVERGRVLVYGVCSVLVYGMCSIRSKLNSNRRSSHLLLLCLLHFSIHKLLHVLKRSPAFP